MPYLKPEDVGDGLSMTFLALSPLQNKPKKDGGTYEAHDLVVQHNDGRTETYNIFPKSVEIGKLNECNAGDQIQAYANGDFVNWRVLPKGEAALQEKQPSNYAQNKRDAALSEQERNHKIKEVMISLAGLTQAYITAGNDDPLGCAIRMRQRIIDAAISEVTND